MVCLMIFDHQSAMMNTNNINPIRSYDNIGNSIVEVIDYPDPLLFKIRIQRPTGRP